MNEEFRKLGIEEPILRSIEQENFEKPSEIQHNTIPSILEGKDVIAGSATGSGKTLAFGVGIIQSITKGNGIQALVLTPTRELAIQVCDSLKNLSKHKSLRFTTVYGGVGINPQIHSLRSADVVVGTPGRMLDHLQRGTIDLSHTKIVVLDEADRMLDMGFITDVENIIKRCSRERQTMLFSATIPPDIQRLAGKYMNNPIKISAENRVDPKKLRQTYFDVGDNMKFSLLVYLLKKEQAKLVMVFCNSQRNTDFVAENLKLQSLNALAIHGGFSQAKREQVMRQFNSDRSHVLVCTDVAARGLDIKGVSHVYNYDIPAESKQYIHRIGRTARAGKEGKAVSIVASRDHENFGRVLNDREIIIARDSTPHIERVRIKVLNQPRNHSRGGFNQRWGGNRSGGGYGSGGGYHSRSRPDSSGGYGSSGGYRSRSGHRSNASHGSNSGSRSRSGHRSNSGQGSRNGYRARAY